ncbi:hypothetical protein [Streptomyces nigrescens]|uniref:hypothetical protein n=1 Tax=Streptomyces nigrescens TaxID=1920 RepID=UPI00348B30D2
MLHPLLVGDEVGTDEPGVLPADRALGVRGTDSRQVQAHRLCVYTPRYPACAHRAMLPRSGQ